MFRLGIVFIAVKMSTHQRSAKPRSSKCCHFCFLFDTHNYCPTCKESGKGDDPCVTNQCPCNICECFSEEQQIKIKHRRYVRKQKASDPCNTSKEDDLDLLGDYVEAFSGSQTDLEGAAEILLRYNSLPCGIQCCCRMATRHHGQRLRKIDIYSWP